MYCTGQGKVHPLVRPIVYAHAMWYESGQSLTIVPSGDGDGDGGGGGMYSTCTQERWHDQPQRLDGLTTRLDLVV